MEDDYPELQNLYAQREKVINNNYHIHQHFNCECTICKNQRMTDNLIVGDIKLDPFYESEEENDDSNDSFVHQMRGIVEKRKVYDPIDLLSLVMKLITPGQKARILNIKVMDTLFFYQREPCVLVYNDGSTRQLKIVKEKGLLSNMLELRNFFINRRAQYDIDVRTRTEKRENPKFNSMEFDQKSAEIVQMIKKDVQSVSITYKDFLLVKFRNGGEQIFTQLETMQLFDKRRIDPIWEQILLVQAFPYDNKGQLTKLKNFKNDERYSRLQYDKENIKYPVLFDRALEYICLLNNATYWTTTNQREHDRFFSQLPKDEQLHFIVYQIVHFFEAHHRRKLCKIRVNFCEDDFGNRYVIDCSQMKFIDIEKIRWNEIILSEITMINKQFQEEIIVELQKKQEAKVEKTRVGVSQNERRLKLLNTAMGEINSHLRENYIRKIQDAEIELQNQPDVDKTNYIFHELNPKINHKFSYLVNVHKDDELILKKQLLNNFPIDSRRYTAQIKYLQDSKAMQQQRSVLKKQNLVKSGSQQVVPKYSIMNKQYLIKTTQLRKDRLTVKKTIDDHKYQSEQTNPRDFTDYKY